MKKNYIKPLIDVLNVELNETLLTMSYGVNNNSKNNLSADGKGRNDNFYDEFAIDEKGFGDLW